MLGRKEIPGRPLIYATTKRFLEVFGLKNLKDLPTPKEIEEFGNSLSDDMAESASEDQVEAEMEAESPEEGTGTPAEEPELGLPAENQEPVQEAEETRPDQDS